jgi:hypothetical protein
LIQIKYSRIRRLVRVIFRTIGIARAEAKLTLVKVMSPRVV